MAGLVHVLTIQLGRRFDAPYKPRWQSLSPKSKQAPLVCVNSSSDIDDSLLIKDQFD